MLKVLIVVVLIVMFIILLVRSWIRERKRDRAYQVLTASYIQDAFRDPSDERYLSISEIDEKM